MLSESEQDAIVDWLTKPEAYSHAPQRVEHIQTHISHVFLAGPYAYKLKKPVKFEFLDFSSIQAREHACREELRLNRRLAPHIYLEVVPIARGPNSIYELAGAGPVADWLLVMQRLPTELTLDALHRRGELDVNHIDRLCDVLVHFYSSLPPCPLTAEQYCERCEAHVRGNLQDLASAGHHLPATLIKRVHGFQLQLLMLDPELFQERVRAGRVIEGHGDLRPEHICFSDPLAIFDCIEFNADFRRLDVADELAFLAAECDFLGAEWVGPRLFQAYQDNSGDRPPSVLLDFYKSYRACVRAKVAALRADQLQDQPHNAAIAEANKHLALADTYIRRWIRPLIIVVGGLSGTGKTTLATELASRVGAELLRTDVIRRELFGSGPNRAAADDGIYTPESRQRVYDAMFRRAEALRRDRIAVVLDGTFSNRHTLDSARGLAAHACDLFLAVECVCSPEIAQQRIHQRQAEGRDASDARPVIHSLQQMRWEAWPTDSSHIQVNTEQPLGEQVARVLAALKAANRQ